MKTLSRIRHTPEGECEQECLELCEMATDESDMDNTNKRGRDFGGLRDEHMRASGDADAMRHTA